MSASTTIQNPPTYSEAAFPFAPPTTTPERGVRTGLKARFKERTASIAKSIKGKVRSKFEQFGATTINGGKSIAERTARALTLLGKGQKGFVYGTTIGQYGGLVVGAVGGAAIGSIVGPAGTLTGIAVGAVIGFGVGMVTGGATGSLLLVGLDMRAHSKQEKSELRQECDQLRQRVANMEAETQHDLRYTDHFSSR